MSPNATSLNVSLDDKSLLNRLLESGQADAGPLPLSFAQQRLWLLDQLRPKSALYNVPSAIRIRGFLNIDALKDSLEAIVERHEILRTVYLVCNAQPVQQVTERYCVELPLVDLSSLPEERRDAELHYRLREEAARPFDLSADLMLRATLFRLNIKEHVLLINIHHIACDEWSLHLLLLELTSLYPAFCEKQPVPLRPLQIQYADFALWQRECFDGDALAKQIDYWRRELRPPLPALELPADRPRPATPSQAGGRESRRLSRGLSNSIKALCRREGATPFMLLLTAFKILLHRYTSQEDIVVGTPIAGRNRVETENLIGFFVNTLVLRSDLSRDPTFRQLLGRIRETCLGAFSYQDLPFEKLVEELQPERTAAGNPLFNVMFAVQSNALEQVEIPGLTLAPMEVDNGTAKFDVTLVVQDNGNELLAMLEYSSDLFDSTTPARLLGHFEALLEGIVANPDQRISLLPLLPASERRQLLLEFNQTTTSYPRNATVHELFLAQAETSPGAVAIEYGAGKLTYAELNRRANQLANHLRKLGVGPDVLVGICCERSIEMVVGWLGILKAGGAYVPLDPGYPAERLAFMLEDTKMPVLLTQKRLAPKLPAHTRRLCLDSDWRTIAREETTAPATAATAEDLAYVIYTSGSTGKPKGVAVPHRAIVRLLFNTNYIQLNSSDRIAQASNSSFDAATFEVWGALLHGGRAIGVTKNTLLSPRDLAAHLKEKRITSIFVTTALFNQIAAEAPGAFAGVKNVLFGGEACDPRAVREVLAQGRPQRLLHVYGPTETTTFASWFEITDVPADATTIPIGKPLSNTTLFVLDRNSQPVPAGIPGELHIGGDALARGYFNRPELTARKFIEDEFSSEPGTRLYRTGDLVRQLPDGNIEFLGRIDNQVKIRGFRIELGEIETVLRLHGLVRDAVVVAREDGAGDKRLIAYVISKQQPPPATDELRRFLKKKLPDFMVPFAFVWLESFPLNPNGKVDRAALPAPESVEVPAENYVPPRNNLENQLAKIWQEVLGHKPVGIRNNFFELGGHSLLAVRLFALIERKLGQKLPLPVLFQAPTIEQLAEVIGTRSWSSPGACLVEIQPHGARPPIFWLHTLGGGGGGGLFTYQKLAQLLGPDQPSYGLVTPPDPFTRIETMATHYICEMRTVQPSGPYFLGGYCFGGVVAYEMARQLAEQGAPVGMLILLESAPPNVRGSSTVGVKLRHFLATVPAWCRTLARQRPLDVAARAGKKVSAIQRKLFHSPLTNGAEVERQLNEVIDFSSYPKDFQRYARIHWRALNDYKPQPFPGCAALFRTRSTQLFDLPHEALWSKLALGGVRVTVVPGTHEQILHEPHVRTLAEALKKSLAQAQTTTRA